jgi:hypothetical protein
MAYIGTNPANSGTGLFSQDTFTGDGSTVAFDLTNVAPDGGGNELQVFVDNVRQQEGSSNAYTLGYDGSSVFKRITFTAAPAASASIYVLNPGTKNVQQISTISDNTVTAAKVQANAITTAKILDNNVTTAKILNNNITVAKLASTLDLSSNTLTLPNNVVNADKIVDDAISEEHLDVTAITGHSELAEAVGSTDVLLVYDTSAGVLKKIKGSNIGLQAPTVSSVSPTSVASGDGTGNYTFVITGSGFGATTVPTLVTNGGSSVSFDSSTLNSPTQFTGVIAKSSLTTANEPYDVKVTTAGALSATLLNQINVDQSPVFVTSSGSLGSFSQETTVSTMEVIATDPDSAGAITFELQSGSLPAGLSSATVNENGVSKFRITGTLTTDISSSTTNNIVVRAVDVASNTSSRAFSITQIASGITSFTASGTFAVPAGITSVDVLVVAGGGGSGSAGAPNVSSGGGGGGGLIYRPGFTVSPGSTVTVTVGAGGGNVGSNHAPGISGQDSVFGTLTAKGGGGGGSIDGAAKPGGSGGGGGTSNGGGQAAGQTIQGTQSGDSGAYGFGNNGGTGAPHSGTSGSGGGGGAAGAGHANSQGGNGGAGKAYTIADGTTPVGYAGGGSGGGGNSPLGGTTVTPFGGGVGNAPQNPTIAGAGNKGGGGGGAGAGGAGTGGGKGIVVVAY